MSCDIGLRRFYGSVVVADCIEITMDCHGTIKYCLPCEEMWKRGADWRICNNNLSFWQFMAAVSIIYVKVFGSEQSFFVCLLRKFILGMVNYAFPSNSRCQLRTLNRDKKD